MHIEQINYFLEIAEVGSISKASQKLFISPQGLSDSIHRLEKELGFPLFIRQRKGVVLTTNGEKFIKYAQSFQTEYNEMMEFASDTLGIYTKRKQEFSILSGVYIAPVLIEWLFSSNYLQQYNLHLYETSFSDIELAFANNRAQIGIFGVAESQWDIFQTITHNSADFMEITELFRDEIVYCMHKDNPLSNKMVITPQDIDLFIDFQNSYHEYLNILQEHSPAIRSNNFLTHIALMEQNSAVTSIPKKLLPYLYPNPDLVHRSYVPQQHTRFYLALNKNLMNDDVRFVADRIVAFLRERFTE